MCGINWEYRLSIYERDGYRCYRCGRAVMHGKKSKRKGLPMATLDHLIPRCRGGGDGPENLKTCCVTCNNRKGAKCLKLSPS